MLRIFVCVWVSLYYRMLWFNNGLCIKKIFFCCTSLKWSFRSWRHIWSCWKMFVRRKLTSRFEAGPFGSVFDTSLIAVINHWSNIRTGDRTAVVLRNDSINIAPESPGVRSSNKLALPEPINNHLTPVIGLLSNRY